MTRRQLRAHQALGLVLGATLAVTVIIDGFGFWFVLALTACVANIVMPFQYEAWRKK